MDSMTKRPTIEMSYGVATCPLCRREFVKRRPWAIYDTGYCRMMHWHLTHRRVTEPGDIVRVDGRTLKVPVPAIDPRLDAEAQRDAESRMRRRARATRKR